MRTYYPDKRKKLSKLLREAAMWEPYLKKNRKKEIVAATCRVLEWLGFAEKRKKAKMEYQVSDFLLLTITRGFKEGQLKSRKPAATAADIDIIESMFEGALGDSNCASDLRPFVVNVLGVLGLVQFTDGGDAVPTGFMRRVVGTSRQEDRELRNEQREEKQLSEIGSVP
jgi:hypothetical protein